MKKQDIPRMLAPALYVLQKLKGRTNKHRLFKILYFADMDHIAKFGRTVTGDTYISMNFGPVPSGLMDCVKAVQGESKVPIEKGFLENLGTYLEFQPKYYILAQKLPDMRFLSESDIESLDSSIALYGHLSFGELTDTSHGPAWEAGKRDRDGVISIKDIAKEAGANEHMLKYIDECR